MAQESLTISNPHGLRLATLVDTPTPLSQHPAVILLHGFTGYKEEPHIALLAKTLAQNNIVAVRFDASGFGQSEGTLEHDYRLSNYYQDLAAVYTWLIQQPFVDAKRIGIWGHSMGALLSIVFAARHSDIAAICALSAPAQLGKIDWLASILNQWKQTGWFEKESSTYGSLRIPYAFIEDAQQYDALEDVQKLHNQHILILLGTADNVVVPQDTRMIFEAAPPPKQIIEIEGLDHAPKRQDSHLQEITSHAVDFFQRYL